MVANEHIGKPRTAVKRVTRTPELAQQICVLVADAKPHLVVAEKLGCSPQFIRDWLKADPEFAAKYALAKHDFAEAKFDELIELADKALGRPPEEVNALRLAVDTRKWVISKLLPKKYGEKADEHHITTIVNNVMPIARQRELQERRQAALAGRVQDA